ncbi:MULTISPECIES: glycosyltransferase family protein [Acinetobacter]|uniref:glycosyl transferase n=1 Tax=Acinetobacter TaxID=469 RepID=UPI00019ADF99|nr:MULTISPECIES: glycosyl transferase [Acinetobacter]EEH69379.1 hypothetical protein HMPREF0023_1100 [Acinetobacter sp. ATCC 27244]
MMNFLYLTYSKNVGFNNIFTKGVRFLCSRVYNFLAPIYYKNIGSKLVGGSEDIVISLTSFPDRIDTLWLVVESLFDQTVKPSKVVLTLSLLQFNGEKDLPESLLKQTKRGLEIIWTEDDLRSHKKYYYAMQKYPSAKIITVDDDFYYSRNMLESLLSFHQKFPRAVICHLAAKKNGCNYKEWTNLLFKFNGPSTDIMQYGGSGVLYPPNSLHKDAFDKEKIKELCPLADDIWLNCMTILNGREIVKTDYEYYLMPLFVKSSVALKNINVGEDMNSKQIQRLNEVYKIYP